MSAFDHPFGFLKHHFGDFYVARGLFVEGRGDDFGFDIAGHFGHFFGTFVDQQDDQVDFRMVVGDCVGDRLQQHRFTGFRLCHDQSPLAFPDRREQIDHPGGQVIVPVSGQVELFGREQRGHVFELYAVAGFVGTESVDPVHLDQREIFFALFRRPDDALYRVAGFQSE